MWGVPGWALGGPCEASQPAKWRRRGLWSTQPSKAAASQAECFSCTQARCTVLPSKVLREAVTPRHKGSSARHGQGWERAPTTWLCNCSRGSLAPRLRSCFSALVQEGCGRAGSAQEAGPRSQQRRGESWSIGPQGGSPRAGRRKGGEGRILTEEQMLAEQ